MPHSFGLGDFEFYDAVAADVFDSYLRADYCAQYENVEGIRNVAAATARRCLRMSLYWWTRADAARREAANAT
jgi:hypothetical protein